MLGTYHEHGQACLIVDPERILDVLGWLRDTPGQEYRFLASLHGVDYLPAEPRFGVVYELLNMPRVERLRVRAALADPGRGDELPEIDSCVSIFPTAEFQEREVYDFFGDRLSRPSRPAAHPDARGLRRLAAAPRLPDRRRAGDLHPQRARRPPLVRMSDLGRDVISRTEAQVIGSSPVERTAAGQALEPEQELMTINMGPHHPATHGVLRLLVSLEGEVVRDLKPVMGYVHTGIEKNCEDKSYWKVIPFVERMDYLSYFFNMEAFVGCVERLLELEIPPRAKYLRVIHLELNRIHSHLVWLGTAALDLGAMSMFFYCFRDRDRILDLFELSTGQRMHTRYFQVGGVFEDIPLGFERKVRAFCAEMPSRIDQYEAILNRNEIFLRPHQERRGRPPPAAARPGGHGAAAACRR